MKKTLSLILFLWGIMSCTPDSLKPLPSSNDFTGKRVGVEGLGYKRVMIIYCEGYNNLTDDIELNLKQLDEGYLPAINDREAILVYAHDAKSKYDWSTPSEPVVYRIYKHYDEIVRDTIKRFPANELSVCAERVTEVMSFIKKSFPSQSYGLVYNSHASGWIPSDYEESSDNTTGWSISPQWIGAEYEDTYTNDHTLDVEKFAQAIPIHLDYIIFDCCLMGGVETNYALRDKTSYIVAAPTEVISEGFDYYNMTKKLLKSEPIDLKGVCEDFYNKLASSSYVTIALYDCAYMNELANSCKEVFAAHPNAAFNVNSSKVQNYNYSFRYHYDFRDIIANMGASEKELESIDKVLEKLVLYKNATPYFIYTPINPLTYSGLSMYLPNSSWPVLNGFYKETDWNKATGLIR